MNQMHGPMADTLRLGRDVGAGSESTQSGAVPNLRGPTLQNAATCTGSIPLYCRRGKNHRVSTFVVSARLSLLIFSRNSSATALKVLPADTYAATVGQEGFGLIALPQNAFVSGNLMPDLDCEFGGLRKSWHKDS